MINTVNQTESLIRYIYIHTNFFPLKIFLNLSEKLSLTICYPLGSVIADTMKFAFLFFEFFVPYTVAFWILFGGHKNGHKMGAESAANWESLNDLTFSVWTVSCH